MSGPERRAPGVVTWCAYAAVIVAMPTAIWRLALAAGHPLGTPEAWRQAQDIPGTGTWYVLALSVIQLAAAACMLALTVEPARLTPRWAPRALARLVPAIVGGAGLLGAVTLALIVAMSAIAWDKVDPFGGTGDGGWAWLSGGSYLLAAFWPPLLGIASVGYLIRQRRGGC